MLRRYDVEVALALFTEGQRRDKVGVHWYQAWECCLYDAVSIASRIMDDNATEDLTHSNAENVRCSLRLNEDCASKSS